MIHTSRKADTHTKRWQGIWLAAAFTIVLALAPAANAQAAAQMKTHLGGKASGMVSLFASVLPNTTASFDVIAHDGTHTAFALPTKTVLVVTDVVVRAINPASSGRLRGSIRIPGGTVGSLVFDFDTSQQLEQHLPLVAGTVMGAAPEVNAESGTVTALVFLYGYLAADK